MCNEYVDKSFSIKNLVLFILISFGFAWFLWGSQILSSSYGGELPLVDTLSNFYNYGAWGPLIAAIVVALISKGIGGVKGLISRTVDLSFKKIWFIPTFLLFPLIIGLPLLIVYLLQGSVPYSDAWANPLVLPIAFVVVLLTTGPLQEEYGWRGTLQPLFQTKINALISSLLVGLIWGLWHLPLFQMPEMGFYYDKPIWGLIISTTLISVLFGWIYNNTKGSMLLMLLFHAMYNFSHYLFPSLESETASFLYMVILVITVVVVVLKTGPSLLVKSKKLV